MSISEAKLPANRANAQHSTGPRTPEGKARAARNHLRHGLLSRQLVLETEDRAAYEEFAAAFREELAPANLWEETLTEQVVTSAWRLKRVAWMETALLDQAMERAMEKDDEWRQRQWRYAREAAKEEGREESSVAAPFPRAHRGEVLPRFAGKCLAELLYERNYLDVLRRYERAIQRGMHESMKALSASRAARENPGRRVATPVECGGRAAALASAEAPAQAPGQAVVEESDERENQCETNPPAAPAECGNNNGDGPQEAVSLVRRPDPSTGADVACPAKSHSGDLAAALHSTAAALPEADCETNPPAAPAAPAKPTKPPAPARPRRSQWLREQEEHDEMVAMRARMGR